MPKRNPPGSGTWFFDQARGRWRYRVSKNGRSRVFYGPTRAAVQRAVADETARQGGQLKGSPDRETLASFAERWLTDTIEPNRAAATARSYRLALKNHILPTLGKRYIAKIEPSEVEALLSSLRRAKIGDRTRQNAYVVLRALFNGAKRLRAVHDNPVSLVAKPKVAAPEVPTLSLEQVAAFLAAARSDRLFALYLLAVSTGMRQGELLGLPWANVHLDEGYLLVTQQAVEGPKGPASIGSPKTKQSRRRVELSSLVIAALRERQDAAKAEMASPMVFPDLQGAIYRKTPFMRRSFYPIFDRMNKERAVVGLPPIPRVTFHSLRHTSASIALSSGVSDLKSTSDRLGHSSIQVTADMYVHVHQGTHREEAEAISRLLDKAATKNLKGPRKGPTLKLKGNASNQKTL